MPTNDSRYRNKPNHLGERVMLAADAYYECPTSDKFRDVLDALRDARDAEPVTPVGIEIDVARARREIHPHVPPMLYPRDAARAALKAAGFTIEEE